MMIVLAPHVLAADHLLEGGNSDHTEEGFIRADENGGSGANNHAMGSAMESGAVVPPEVEDDEETARMMALMGEDALHRWQETRLQVSALLGSIGAPPLDCPSQTGVVYSPEATMRTVEEEEAIRPDNHGNSNDESGQRSRLFRNQQESVLDMTAAHVALLQTMHRMLESLSVGASVRLGLGPIHESAVPEHGNRRLVARAEKSWVAHELRRRNGTTKSEGVQTSHPLPLRLSMHRARTVLHRVMADQAASLQRCSRIAPPHAQQYPPLEDPCGPPLAGVAATDWGEFARDLQHSLPPSQVVLTLSRLRGWACRLGDQVSTCLSVLLARPTPLPAPGRAISTLGQSAQSAREQTALLHAAFPLCRQLRPPEDVGGPVLVKDGCTINVVTAETNTIESVCSAAPKQRKQGQVEKDIVSLRSALTAARVCLWAFESYRAASLNEKAREDDTGAEDAGIAGGETPEVWWRGFRNMLDRAAALTSDVEMEVQRCATPVSERNSATRVAAARADAAEGGARDSAAWAEEEHVSTAAKVEDERVRPWDKGQGAGGQEQNKGDDAKRTQVFMGSGMRKPPPRPSGNLRSRDQKCSPQPPGRSLAAADPTLLLQDLKERLEAIGMSSKEHEVVVTSAETDEALDKNHGIGTSLLMAKLSHGPKQTEKKSQPFFLGVSGSLLAELSTTITQGISPCDADISNKH